MKNGKVEKKLSMFRGSRSDTTRQAGITRSTPSLRHTVLRRSGHNNNGSFRLILIFRSVFN
jgi:hypothetical protein